MRNIIWYIFTLFILSSQSLEATHYRDITNRNVQIGTKVKRIICIGPGALRLIVYLEAEDKVVAVENIEKAYPEGRPYILAHPELSKLPTFAKGGPPGQNPINDEKILLLKPDIIFVTYMSRQASNDLQNKLGIPVFVLSYGQFATFDNKTLFRSLLLAGNVLGKKERAKEIISYIKNIEKDLNRRIADINKEKVPSIYVGGLGYKGAHGINSTIASLPTFSVINIQCVTDKLGLKGWIPLDREKILQWNPDLIFIDEGGLKITMYDARKNPSFYKSLNAVRNDNVFGLLPYNYYTTNIETALTNAYFAGKVIYRKKFEDINIKKKADEIFSFFVGAPVYSEMKKEYRGYTKIKLIQ